MKREIKKETEKIWRYEYNKIMETSREVKEKIRLKNKLIRKESLKTSMTKIRDKLKIEVAKAKLGGNFYMVIN